MTKPQDDVVKLRKELEAALLMNRTLNEALQKSIALRANQRNDVVEARPLEEWHEDMGFVTWWKFPVNEPAWIGSPHCSDWPGYHTHFTPHPPIPETPKHGGNHVTD